MRAFVSHQTETAQKLVNKLNPGLGNKYEKAKMFRDIQGAKNVTAASGTQCVTQGNPSAMFVGNLFLRAVQCPSTPCWTKPAFVRFS